MEGQGKVPVLVITARSLGEFLEWAAGGPPFLSVFVDAPDEALDARLRIRDGTDQPANLAEQRAEDRKYRVGNVLVNIDRDASFKELLALWGQVPLSASSP